MLQFFRDNLARLHAQNAAWIKSLTADEETEVPAEMKQLVSEVINERYLWICEYKRLAPDLELNDLLPEYAWLELELDNGREIDSICDLTKEENLAASTFYPLLYRSIANLGKLDLLAKQLGLNAPDLNLIKVIL